MEYGRVHDYYSSSGDKSRNLPGRVTPVAIRHWGPTMSPQIREARLRTEFAGLYPFLTPDVWEPAHVLAMRLLASALARGIATPRGRLLDDRHFDFRQDSPRPRLSIHRTRREDAGDTV